MSGYTWRLFDWFKANKGASTTRLAINSNLGFEQDKLERLLDATEGTELDLYTSNESWGRHAMYIRDGLDWDQWVNNVMFLLDSGKLRGLHVMCTINALCLLSLTDLLWMIVKLKQKYGKDAINFSLNILRFPSFQSPLVLSDELRTHYRDQLVKVLTKYRGSSILQEHEHNHLQRLIDYLDVVKTPHSEAFELPKLRNDFKQFYTQYDQRRNKNFASTFPALKEWYNDL
jgi:hypothetical protein